MKNLLIPIILLVNIPLYPLQARFNKNNFICFEKIYQKKYIPKNIFRPSYVKIIEKEKKISCKKIINKSSNNNKFIINTKLKFEEFYKWFKKKSNLNEKGL
tara:strand:- start:32 stop:334 length:303 start_codon:yes stop_codon:yes gene_type:complete